MEGSLWRSSGVLRSSERRAVGVRVGMEGVMAREDDMVTADMGIGE